MFNKIKIFTLLLLVSFFFNGCGRDIPTPQKRLDTLNSLIKEKNYKKNILEAKEFDLYSVQDLQKGCKDIRVYIEGDGLSWITRRLKSDDPTPINPIALKLMLNDKNSCKLYIARPCQYISSSKCKPIYWTSHRFASSIIESYVDVLNSIKKEYENGSFSLIGYSGGGAIASLTANRLDSVTRLYSVAGNLDIDLWCKEKRLTKLHGSLNPIDHIDKLENVKQYHLLGSNDNVIPKQVQFSYMSKFKNKNNIVFKTIDATHSCCYENDLQKLIQGKE